MKLFEDVDDIIKTKLLLWDLTKDSPVVLSVAFYEPLQGWLSTFAEDWNPILQLLLNIIAIIWGVARLIPLFKKWFGNDDNSGTPTLPTIE